MVPPSDVVLEINELAARDGWSISAEGELDSSRKPDLLLTQLGRRFVVEVTIQGLSRVMRQAESFGHVLSSLTFAVEHEFGVASHIQAPVLWIRRPSTNGQRNSERLQRKSLTTVERECSKFMGFRPETSPPIRTEDVRSTYVRRASCRRGCLVPLCCSTNPKGAPDSGSTSHMDSYR
jgi:hypothetical protein